MNQHWKNWIGWSNVRQQLWDECPRAFYNRYIGRWYRGRKGGRLARLSNLRTLRAHGSIYVMDVLGTQLHHALLGRGTDPDQAREMLMGKFDYLARHRELLVEHANGLAVVDGDIDRESARGRKLLDNFFKKVWPGMSKAAPLEHGRILSYDVGGHRVWLNVDAAFRDGKSVVVTQISPGRNGFGPGPAGAGSGGRARAGGGIKTGSEPGAFQPESAARALWAMKLYRLPLDRVKLERLDLERPDLSRVVSVKPVELKRFKEHVVRMCERWERIKTNKDAMPTPERKRCRACAYATECTEGRKFMATPGGRPADAQGATTAGEGAV